MLVIKEEDYRSFSQAIQASLLDIRSAQPMVKYMKQSKVMGREELRKITPNPIMHNTNIHVFTEYTAPRQVPSSNWRMRRTPRRADLSRMKYAFKEPARSAKATRNGCQSAS